MLARLDVRKLEVGQEPALALNRPRLTTEGRLEAAFCDTLGYKRALAAGGTSPESAEGGERTPARGR